MRLFIVALGILCATATGWAAVPEPALPHGVRSDWWNTVQAQIAAEEYHVTWQAKTSVPGLSAAWQAPNRAHNLRAYFTPEGPRVVRRTETVPSWTWGLELVEVCGKPAPASGELAPHLGRIDYPRSGLVEWYANDERGLEQGFTLTARPAHAVGDALILELAVRGDLIPGMTSDGQAVEFVSRGGVQVLQYGHLKAWDAAGRELPSCMAIPDPATVKLIVDAAGAQYPVTIDPLVVDAAWSAESDEANASFGASVSTAGDVNGDGFDDVIVGAPNYDHGATDEGRAFVYHGSAAGLAAGAAWRVESDQAYALFGTSVATAGDVNGDGFSDVIVGAPSYDGAYTNEGQVLVYHGSVSGLSPTADWTDEGGQTGASLGMSVSTAGDVNNDGFTEVIAGAPTIDETETDEGMARVYRGSAAGISEPIWFVWGGQQNAYFGASVAAAGDVNGDGYGDVLVGAPSFSNGQADEGRAYLYHGFLGGLSIVVAWSAEGEQAGAAFGSAVSTAGDVNGDGYADVIVGARYYDGGHTDEGRAWVYHGSATGVSTTATWTAEGDQASAWFGWSVSEAGDFNGDGFGDVVVGAPSYDNGQPDEGRVSVYYGSEAGLSAIAAWSVESGQTNGWLGRAVSAAGDVNGDGFGDVIAGAPLYDGGQENEGRAFVYLGAAAGLTSVADWIADGNQAGSYFGEAVASAGDVNGDGYDDVIVGARLYDHGEANEGLAFVYHGSGAGLALASAWTAEINQAGAMFGHAVGAAGDVNGDGYGDIIVSALDYDNGEWNEGAVFVYHGSVTGLSAAAVWMDEGDQQAGEFGRAVGTAGDVNGDSYADVIVGARGYSNGEDREGAAFVYHGSAAGLSAAPNWIGDSGQAGAYAADTVSTAGDVNGDGFADVIVGAHYYSGSHTFDGRAWVYHGSAVGLSATANWIAEGEQANTGFGYAVCTAGDVNGDGYADVIVGSPSASHGESSEGFAWVYHGSAGGLSATADWVVESDQERANLGFAVSTAGDVNGDGYADVMVGAPANESAGYRQGRVLIYHGAPAGLDPVPAWIAECDQASASLGWSLSTAGDVNGDGFADVVVGAPFYSNGEAGEGRVYVYYGTGTGVTSGADWNGEGNQLAASFGWSAAAAGDVNADGYADVVVGAPHYDHGETDEGRAYLYYGTASGLSRAAAWTAESDQAYAEFGWSVASAGDVNGDSHADVIVGARSFDGGETNEGRAFVYHGAATGLTPAAVWAVSGDRVDERLGSSVSTAGDVNGDGYSDVLVGAPSYSNGQAGEGGAWVYYGSGAGLSATPGWGVESGQAGAGLGWSVATAGDINGDDYADVIIGAPFYSNGEADEGRAWVYHGAASGLSLSAAWSAESDQASAGFGGSVASAGDVNGDGYDDVIVGACYYDGGQTDEGRAYVYHGSPAGLAAGAAWTAGGGQASAWFGWSVAGPGDFNGDGFADVLVGAPSYDNGQTDEGRAYLYHGSGAGLASAPSWTAEGGQANAWFGRSVAAAGDVNGDDVADIIVGAPIYDKGQENEGRVYVYYGSLSRSPAGADWSVVGDQGGAQFGWTVATAGDVNRDGFADVIVGAATYDNGQQREGRAFVYHGSGTGLIATAAWVAESDQISALFGDSVSTAGDVNGDGFADVIVGAPDFSVFSGGQFHYGRAFVYHGSPSGLLATATWTANSDSTNENFGCSVATAGDVNADGFDDVIIGAPVYDSGLTATGRVYVYHGTAAGLHVAADWSAQDSQPDSWFGCSVSSAGDVNGDGCDDVLVGAHYHRSASVTAGQASVYEGSVTGLSSSAAWTAQSDQSSLFGISVSTAGDVNGDGFADVIVGASAYENGEGRAAVYHGSPLGLSPVPDWTAEGNQWNAAFGRSVAAAGDVNGDGFGDVVVGAPTYGSGRVAVFYGSLSGLSRTQAWGAEGDRAGGWFGFTVSLAGDVNGDGFADVIVGEGSGGEGRVYVYYGKPTDNSEWRADGNQFYARLGYSLATAGDVNGDGFADVIVGAPYYDNGQADEGRALVYHGSTAGLATRPSWTAESDQANANLGWSVSTAGDVNGDGFFDVIVGAPFFIRKTEMGQARIYHGSAAGLSARPDWTADPNQANAAYGWSVATAGDVNGDGYSDVLVGAPYYDGELPDEGRAWVYHGSRFGASDTAAWTTGGGQEDAEYGWSVGTAGDVNGDGYSEVIVGAPAYDHGENNEGAAFVYFGADTGLATVPDWEAEGDQAGARFGGAVSTAGDVNGDGFADVLVGSAVYGNGEVNEGRVWLYYGAHSRLPPSAGWTAEANQTDAAFGSAVSTAGDINGDGYADVLIGAYGYDNGQVDEGRAFAYYGSNAGLGTSAVWTVDGGQVGANLGWSVATAGDVNGDGYADLLVGAPAYDARQQNEGRALVYYGAPAALSDTAAWDADGGQAETLFGWSVAAAGDVNGDGFGDVLVGAPGFDSGQFNVGRLLVYHGAAGGLPLTPVWTVVGDQANASLGGSVSSAGDVNGDGFDDIIAGAARYSNGQQEEGLVRVYHGSATGLALSPEWSAEGNQASAGFGGAVAVAGDVNGDGYSDVIVGASLFDGSLEDEGAAWVYHGSSTGLASTAAWGVTGGQTNARLGHAVSTAGDVNGDGFADVIVGAPFYDSALVDAGAVRVYHGSGDGLSSTAAWIGEGDHERESYGVSVSQAGDVNGDGFADVIVGALVYSSADGGKGRAFVYHGSIAGLSPVPDWSTWSGRGSDWFGLSVAGAGDVNGDGCADVIVSAPSYSGAVPLAGRVWVHFGSTLGLSSLADWTADGNEPGADFGHTACTAGDVNGDGYADVIIAAPEQDNALSRVGRACVYYGNGVAGGGLSLAPQVRRADNSAPVAAGGQIQGSVRVAARGRTPFGRGNVKLELELKPQGTPFNGADTLTSAAWEDTAIAGVGLNELATGLAGGPHHWRARLHYHPAATPFQQTSRWFSVPNGGWQEGDFRSQQYRLLYLAGTPGTILGQTPQLVGHGGSGGTVTAVPAPYYQFLQWSDGVPTPARADINVSSNITVTARFHPELAALGTPHWWLAQHGLTNGGWTFDQAETNNPDADPHSTRREYIADTDPTNGQDFLRITGISNGAVVNVFFETSSNRLYTMVGVPELPNGTWNKVPGAGPRMGSGGIDMMQDTNILSQTRHYRLKVALPE